MISKELEETLQRAYKEAFDRRHQVITLEHLLYAITFEPYGSKLLKSCGADIKKLRKDIQGFLETSIPKISKKQEPDPDYTTAVQKILQIAAYHVESSRKVEINSGNLLVAFFQEKKSHAVYYLGKQNIKRIDIVKYISHGISKVEIEDDLQPALHEGQGEEDIDEKKVFDRYCLDLNQKAVDGGIDPLIGRKHEVERIVHILARRRKNNPILVGDTGVGKTAIVEGLAVKIVKKEVPKSLLEKKIYSLDMGGIIAGTKFRGQFEERLKAILAVIKKQEHAVLFIDEIHTIIGAGATSGGSMDASNILKPSLANAELTCIGSTTYQEYKSYFEKDRALTRRFQKVEVGEPSIEECYLILQGLKTSYEEYHEVQYTDEALRTAAELSAKYINDRFLPDKAIDVIDEVGAKKKLQDIEDNVITRLDVENMVAKMAKIPANTVQADDQQKLKDLDGELKKVVFGQNAAIEELTTAIKLSRSGLTEPNKPIGSFLFTGPTGVGKTEIAKQLAKIMGIELIRFDMSEYMEKHTISRLIGAPPGYVGFDQGGLLTDGIHRHPHCVLLLDEIEKAHIDLFNILLQVMDHATLTDNNGRKSDFRNVILIMTTNAGAKEMSAGMIGFNQEFEKADLSTGAIEKLFSPELRNRLTNIIGFKSLTIELVEKIVDKSITALNERLSEKELSVSITNAARTYLAKKGYDPAYGARPIEKLIQKEIAQVLSEKILFEEMKKDQKITVGLKDGKLDFRYK
ncbi:ATP-dependent Clp protease ATP-binding subunit ClpA [Candidatus Uabimicrobium helgolandensis]